jgi:hypothetical protein
MEASSPILGGRDPESQRIKDWFKVEVGMIGQQLWSISITETFSNKLLPQIEWSQLLRAATELDRAQEVVPMSRVSHIFQLCFYQNASAVQKHPHVY